MLTVSTRGMLVNSESTSRLAINNLESCETISLAKENESLVVYIFIRCNTRQIGNKIFANLYEGVQYLLQIKWVYMQDNCQCQVYVLRQAIPGLEPDGHNLKYTSLVILPLSNKLLKIAFKRVNNIV